LRSPDAYLRYQGHRRDLCNTAQSLDCFDDRIKRPVRKEFHHLPGQPVAPFLDLFDAMNVFFHCNLLRSVIKPLRRQPVTVSLAPMGAAFKDPAVPKQERQEMLACTAQIRDRRLPGPAQIAHRLMHLVGNPDGRQLTSAQQHRKRHSIATVCLYLKSRTGWNQRWRNHEAFMAETGKLAI
jgi:hypothetical protein